MIGGFAYYVADLLFYFFAMGVVLHLFDRAYGVKLYRWWYRNSREHPLPEGMELGIMYNQPFAWRHKLVLWVSGIQSIYMLWFKGISIITEVFAWALEAWAILAGFAFGKYVYSFIRGERKLATTIERASAADLLQKAKGWLSGLMVKAAVKGKAAPVAPPQPEPVALKEPESPVPHWRDRLDSLTKRGGSQ